MDEPSYAVFIFSRLHERLREFIDGLSAIAEIISPGNYLYPRTV